MILAIVFLVCVALVALLLWLPVECRPTTSPHRNDFLSPMNLLLYRNSKGESYTSSSVNVWVDKPWNDEGDRIPCTLLLGQQPNSPATPPGRALWVFSHGGDDNLGSCLPAARDAAAHVAADLLVWEYPGYGLNRVSTTRTGESERSSHMLDQTLLAVLQHAVQQLRYRPEDITLVGFALGCGPTLQAALSWERGEGGVGGQLRGLTLFAPFSSVRDYVRDHLGPQLSEWVQRRWDNVEAVAQLQRTPVRVVHGELDHTVPSAHARRLHLANEALVTLVPVPRLGHHLPQRWWERVVAGNPGGAGPPASAAPGSPRPDPAAGRTAAP